MNLRIEGDALVDCVEFEGNRAVAIRVQTREGSRRIAGGEIILSAGAIHSPAILMRSGMDWPGSCAHRNSGVWPICWPATA